MKISTRLDGWVLSQWVSHPWVNLWLVTDCLVSIDCLKKPTQTSELTASEVHEQEGSPSPRTRQARLVSVSADKRWETRVTVGKRVGTVGEGTCGMEGQTKDLS